MRSPVALLLALLLVAPGCASDLLVQAPPELPRFAKARLGALPALEVSLGPVSDAPPLDAAVGERGAATLQPGGPIHLTEDVGTVLRRTVAETLDRSGHRVVASGGDAHLALRALEFRVDVPRGGVGWEVVTRVRLSIRVSKAPGDPNWDELTVMAERSRPTAWRPGLATVEPVLRDCLAELAGVLSRREELAAALAKYADVPEAG